MTMNTYMIQRVIVATLACRTSIVLRLYLQYADFVGMSVSVSEGQTNTNTVPTLVPTWPFVGSTSRNTL